MWSMLPAKLRADASASSGNPTITPGPSSERAIYGFALFLAALASTGIYLVWAFVPPPVLKSIGIDFLPSRYWAVVIPLCLCSLIFVIPIIYGLICLRMMPEGGLEHIAVDIYSRPEIYEQVLRTPPGCIPPLCDIPVEGFSGAGDRLISAKANVKKPKFA